uniref:Uncharacterized protein n=1 Tax=Hemiselmis andersenii TaxID=464988 RepID=A0A6T8IHA5_HEMAN|mmetsp:Transcript_26287/g.60921  ORF Transcript_26287/g.60921 Transcript_26287/m.60921 type:complete len:263 (-) Transcript_26287:260-1048(-)
MERAGTAGMEASQRDERDESSLVQGGRTPLGSYRRRTPGMPVLAFAVLLGSCAVSTDAAPGFGPAMMGKGGVLVGKLPFMSGKAMSALKSKGLAFQWQSFQKAAGGIVSMRADVTARFKKNWDLANENWYERTETLAQMAPTALVTAVKERDAAAPAGKVSKAQREEEEEADAARKAGLSETQYRHMMTHYKTLRPKTYLQKLKAEEEEAATGAADTLGEAPVLGATAQEEAALGKRREKIHESRRLRQHARHGITLYPMQA